MKPCMDGFWKRVCIFAVIAYAVCFVLTAAAAQSGAELDRLREKITETRMEKVNSIPPLFPEDIFTDGAAAFDHEYTIMER